MEQIQIDPEQAQIIQLCNGLQQIALQLEVIGGFTLTAAQIRMLADRTVQKTLGGADLGGDVVPSSPNEPAHDGLQAHPVDHEVPSEHPSRDA